MHGLSHPLEFHPGDRLALLLPFTLMTLWTKDFNITRAVSWTLLKFIDQRIYISKYRVFIVFIVASRGLVIVGAMHTHTKRQSMPHNTYR